jgi:hypothetical protein
MDGQYVKISKETFLGYLKALSRHSPMKMLRLAGGSTGLGTPARKDLSGSVSRLNVVRIAEG